MRSLVLILSLAAPCVVGCGGAAAPPADAQPQPANTADLKKKLLEIAERGGSGSALFGLSEAIEEIKKTDAPKGDKLLADLKRLESTANIDQQKQIANQMADQL